VVSEPIIYAPYVETYGVAVLGLWRLILDLCVNPQKLSPESSPICDLLRRFHYGEPAVSSIQLKMSRKRQRRT
jgi:hypothetical protein